MKNNLVFLNGNQNEKLQAIKEMKDNGKFKSGAFVKIVIKTKKNTYAKAKANLVEKESEIVVRLNILYANTKKFKNQNKVLSPLPQNEIHLVNYENLITYNTEKDTYYLRAFTSEIKPKTKWLLNGVEVSKEDLKDISSDSMLASRPFDSGIFKIKLDNVIAIETL